MAWTLKCRNEPNQNAETHAADYVRRLIQMKVAGVALMTAELDPSLIDELLRKKVRVVFNDLGIVNEYMSNVVLDYAIGIEEAVKHLVSLGHKNIAHIAGASRIRSGIIRREAFLDSMKRSLPDFKNPIIVEGDFRFDSGRAAAIQLLGMKKNADSRDRRQRYDGTRRNAGV